MSRAKHCRERAALCREIAARISDNRDVQHMNNLAAQYEAEATGLEETQTSQMRLPDGPPENMSRQDVGERPASIQE